MEQRGTEAPLSHDDVSTFPATARGAAMETYDVMLKFMEKHPRIKEGLLNGEPCVSRDPDDPNVVRRDIIDGK